MNNIESQFRRYSNDIHVPPSQDAWIKLADRLHANKKRKPLWHSTWYRLAAAMIGVILVTGITYNVRINKISTATPLVSTIQFDHTQDELIINQINQLHHAYARLNMSIKFDQN